MVICLFSIVDFVVSTCLEKEQKGPKKLSILHKKILGYLKVFFLGISDLRIHLVMVILAIFLVVIWCLGHLFLVIP